MYPSGDSFPTDEAFPQNAEGDEGSQPEMPKSGNRWFLDDESLDTCAYAIKNRSATWSMAARRGDNYFIPGRDGSSYNRGKAYDEGTLNLSMFAAGADLDGTMPPEGTTAWNKVRDHLDMLSRLFGKDKLMELVYAERQDYGRVNLIPNPSMENFGQLVVVRENRINNPSGEYSDGKSFWRLNYCDNPAMEAQQARLQWRVNEVPNPRMANEAPLEVQRTNLVRNPSIETGTRFWRAHNNATIDVSRRTRSGGTWPAQGKQSLRLTAIADGNANCEATSILVEANKTYNYSTYVYNRSYAARTVRVLVRWFNKNGNFISDTADTDITVGTEETARISNSATAPAGAVNAVMRITVVDATEDDILLIDGAQFTLGATLRRYFDGDTDEHDGLRYMWVDDPAISASVEYIVRPKGWQSNQFLSCSSDRARKGSQSGRVEITDAAAADKRLFRQTHFGGSSADEGDWLCGAISVMLDPSMSDQTRTVDVNIRCYDSDGQPLGYVVDENDTPLTDEPLELEPGHWQTVAFESGKAIENTAKVVLEVSMTGTWVNGDVAYFDCGIIERAKRLGDYFDGSTTSDEIFDYAWAIDPHWSISTQAANSVAGWNVSGGKQYQTTDARAGDHGLSLQPFRGPESWERPRIAQETFSAEPGQMNTFSIWAKTNRNFNVVAGISLDEGETWTWENYALTSGSWTQISITADLDGEQNPNKIRVGVQYGEPGDPGDPLTFIQDGDEIVLDSAMFEPTDIADKYFNGNSGAGYYWATKEHRSTSVLLKPTANGWRGIGSAKPLVRQLTTTDAPRGDHVIRAKAVQTGNMGVSSGQDSIDDEDIYSFGIDVRSNESRAGVIGIAWYNDEGDEISETTSAITVTTSFSRKTYQADPPDEAVVGAPFVRVENVEANDTLDVDRAIFGFGVDTSYADGTFVGWHWTNKAENAAGASAEWGVGVAHWRGADGTLVSIADDYPTPGATWTSDRDHSAQFTITSETTAQHVYALAKGEDDQRRFRIKPNKLVTFAVDVHSDDVDIQAEARLLTSRWHGGWSGSTTPNVTSEKIDIAAGQTKRIHVTASWEDMTGNATHFRPAAYVFTAAGGILPAGTVVRFDRASLSYDDQTDYIDGQGEWIIWTGEKDNSPSKRIGPARRAWVERVSAVDFSDLGGGKFAEFAVELKVPAVFWESTLQETQKLAIPRSGGVIRLDKFTGCTAPINDAEIRVNGPIADFTITDMGSGQWIRVNRRLKDDQTIVINNDNWTVQTAQGKSRIGDMSHAAGSSLLSITVPNDDDVPRLMIEADSIGRGATITVTAREKYQLA